MNTPIGVAVRSTGAIYVAACGSNQIMRAVAGSAASIYSDSSLFACPNGLTVDDQDNLYTVNFNGGQMVQIDTAGNARVFATIPGNGNGHVVFGNDRFYVAASRANQIYQVDRQGQVTLLAGTGQFGATDGAPEDARFNRPNGIAISPDGRTLYVSQRRGAVPVGGLHPNSLRAIDLDVGDPPVAINAGMRGSWYTQGRAGQGILLDLVADTPIMFAAWYTFIADGEQTAAMGNGQRWYSLQGEYAGDRAELLIYENTGGRFGLNDPVSTVAVGTFVLEFVSCTSAIASYEFTTVARSGTLQLTRLSPDVLCASLVQ